MKKIEQLLSTGKPFDIDMSVCMKHAQVISSYIRPIEIFSWSSKPNYIQLTFKVSFIAICHQFNWDFMQNTLAKYLLADDVEIVELLERMDARTIAKWLSAYPKQERVRAKERAEILRDVGRVLRKDFGGDLQYFYECCEKATVSNIDFYAFLDKFEGYRTDPLKKKTNVLTHDLLKENIVSFEKGMQINPAIDYHIMRLYLRTGRVIPTDKAIFKYLEGAPNPRGALVKKLREAVSEAEANTAFYSKLNVADVNYIEWQIGRSICLNNKPICQNENKVISIPSDVSALCKGNCPYIDVCWAASVDKKFIDFEEPIYISKNY